MEDRSSVRVQFGVSRVEVGKELEAGIGMKMHNHVARFQDNSSIGPVVDLDNASLWPRVCLCPGMRCALKNLSF